MADLSEFMINSYEKSIKDLADKPEMSAADLKAWFDGRTDKEIKALHNGLVNWVAANVSTKVEVTDQIENKMMSIGAGDMQKSVYDKNGNGAVDSAEAAGTAEKLKTARKIKLTGGISAETDFDGSKDVSIEIPNIRDGTKLPLEGGKMKGYLDFGVTNQGLMWTTADDTVFKLRAWSPSNVLQITRTPKGGGEVGVLNIHTKDADFAGNAATATTAATCSGNAATASKCTGNAATATIAWACNGNAYTATSAQGVSFSIGSGNAHLYSSRAQELYIAASGESAYDLFFGTRDGTWNFSPAISGNNCLGSASYKWGQIYSQNSQISTSDRNEKHDIITADAEKMLQFLIRLRAVSYKLNSGTSGRRHYGFIAQEVEEIMQECGISDMDFAGFIKSPKYETVQVFTEEYLDEETFEIVPAEIHEESVLVPNEYIYGLRYDEFIAPMLSVIKTQEARLNAFEARLAALEGGVT